MAIIYSYPEKASPSGGDFLVITDSEQPAPNKNRTKSLTVDNLASYIVGVSGNITGGGTLNTIPLFTPNGEEIGDSIMTFTTGPDTITVGGRLSTTGDLVVGNRSTFAGYARFNGEVRDAANSSGTAGQVLNSTGAGTVVWATNASSDTTYDLTGQVSNITDFAIGLLGSDGTLDKVFLKAGSNITLTDDGSNGVTIASSNPGGTVTGTGTVNKLTKWSSGGTGIQNSNITDNGSLVTISSPTDQTGKAIFRTGIVLSSSPGGVTVDDTSMVIGAGNNDIISGADHCLAVGNNNQILTNSDNSISVGQGNTMTEGTACAIFGLSNTITGSNTITERCLVAGFSNSISAAKSAIVLGGSNTLNTNGGQGIILGSSNNISGTQSNDSGYILGNNVVITTDSSGDLQNAFGIGANLELENGQMVLGYRNLSGTFYPAVNYNQGLGETKFVVSVGTQTGTNSNALIITEGGVTRGTASAAQVPRIVMPTIVGFNFADDTAAAAGGIPVGGLYHNAGELRIRLT